MDTLARNGQDSAAVRLDAVRAELKQQQLDGFLVPRSDDHNGEYIAPYAERLSWLTGFDGSAGIAIVLSDQAAVFVDGRYTLQAADQVDTSRYDIRHVTEDPPNEWLQANLSKGMSLGFDPRLHTERSLERIRKVCKEAGAALVTVDRNPIDTVWSDQPESPAAPLAAHDITFTGESSTDKRTHLAADLVSNGISGAVLTAPDSIAWLLNVRGADVPNTPISLSYALLRDSGDVDLFIDPRKLDDKVRAHLGNGVTTRAESELPDALRDLGGQKILADPNSASAWILQLLDTAGAEIVRETDPCQLPKACKNPIELDGTRAAHRRDGASLTRFLCWFAHNASDGDLDELSAAARLRSFRDWERSLYGSVI